MFEKVVVREGRRVAFNACRISEAITAAFDTIGYAASGLFDALGGALAEYTHRLCEYWVAGTQRLSRFVFTIAHDLAHLVLHYFYTLAMRALTVETYNRDTALQHDAAIKARMDALAATFLGSVQPIWKGAMIRCQNRGSTESVSENDNCFVYQIRVGDQRSKEKILNIIIRGGPYEHAGQLYQGLPRRSLGVLGHDQTLFGNA